MATTTMDNTQSPPKNTDTKFKWEAGKEYHCIKSASPGYKAGDSYICYTNARGEKCLKGNDGFEDLCSMLVSSFRLIDRRSNKGKLRVV